MIEGFESQNGMELLSTVHWVVTQEFADSRFSEQELIEKVHAWNPRKARMKPNQILAALSRLQQAEWLTLKAPTAAVV